jgi:hypothetical protein
MAPASRLAERWRLRLGEEAWARWRESDAFEVKDYATGKKTFVDHAFIRELAEIDDAGDGFPDVRVPACIMHGTEGDTVDVELSRTWAKNAGTSVSSRSTMATS